MAVTRIKNNQITDATVVANAKLVNYSVSSNKLANNLVYGSDLTVTGNLTVQGNTTAIDTTITTIEDPVIVLASTQTTGSPTVDIGFLGFRGNESNIAFVWDESADEFVTAFTSTGETNTTITISSYANFHTKDANIGGNLAVNGNVTFVGNIASLNVTGNISGGNLSTAGQVTATGNVSGGNVTTAGQVTATGNVTGGNLITIGTTSTGSLTASTTISATGNVSGGNVTTAGQVTATGNVSGGNLTTAGNVSGSNLNATSGITAGTTISATGNITGGNLITTGTTSTGSLTASTTISATGNVSGGNLTTAGQVAATGNVSGGNITTAGQVAASGNVSGAYIIGDGSQLSNVTASSVNAANLTGNTLSSNVLFSSLTSVGTLSSLSVTGNIAGGNITTAGNVNGANLNATSGITAGTTVVATGNVSGGNITTAGQVAATGNVSGGNLTTAGAVTTSTVSATGNITGGNVTTAGQVTATGNVTGGNLSAGSGTIFTTGNVNGGNINATSNVNATTITASANVNGGNITTAGITSTGSLTASTTISATGNITGGNLSTAGQIAATGNISGGNVTTAGQVTATGNITGGNLSAGTGTISTTGNINGGNVNTNNLTGNAITITGTSVDFNLTGNVSLSGRYITDLADPVQAQDAATKKYVDEIAQGLDPKASCLLATATALPSYTYSNGTAGVGATITLSSVGNLTIDGTVVAANERILVKNETSTNTPYNGIYVVTTAGTPSVAAVLTRATDFDSGSPTGEIPSAFTFIERGSVNADTGWVCTTNSPVTVGTTPITFTQFSGAGTYSAGNALSLNGTQFNVNTDGNISINGSNQLFIAAGATLVTPNIGAATGTSLSTTGNISTSNLNSSGQVVATGNVSGGNLSTAGQVVATGNVSGGNITTAGTTSTGSLIASSTISATGNITGGNVSGTNLTGTLLTASQPNITSVGTLGSLAVTGNVSGGNLSTAGQVTATGNVSGGNVTTAGQVTATGNVSGGNVTTAGQVTATGNITGGNVTTAGITSTGSLTASTTISATGNVSGGNLSTAGQVAATGNVTGGNLITTGTTSTGSLTATTTISATGNVSGGNLSAGSGTISTTGNVNGGNVNATTGVTSTTVTATGNIAGGNINTAGTVNATGNINGTGAVFSGNVTAANFIGNISGNIDAGGANTNIQFNDGDILAGSSAFTFNKTTNAIVATGNITSGNVTTAGTANIGTLAVTGTGAVTGNLSGGNINTAGQVVATGNVSGGNVVATALITGANVTATANVTGANIVGTTSGTFGNIVISGDNITDTNGRVNFNTAGADVDFAVNGDTVANVFYVDAGTGTASFGSATQTTNAIVAFNSTTSILAPVGNTAQRPATGVTGMLRFNTTSNSVEVYDNTEWTSVGVPVFTVIDDEQFNGDGSTVAFTLGSTQTTNSCIVSINGVVQIPTTAYSVSGTDPTCVLTFTEAPASGDLIDVRQITTTTTVTSIANSSGNAVVAVSPTSAQVNVTGDLSVSGTILGGNINSTAITNGTSSVSVISSGGNIRSNVSGATVQTISAGLVAITGDLSVSGNATLSGNILGDRVQNGTTSFDIQTASGNANITVGATSNVAVFSPTLVTMAANLMPAANITYDLGSTTQRWKDLWLSNSTIYLGNSQISANATSLIFTNPLGGQTVLAGATAGITGATVSASGNITGGNILTAGLISATGNITGNYILGNGSQLTGIDATSIQNGTANVRTFLNGNVTTSAGGTANVLNVTSTGTITTGTASVTGNVTGGNVSATSVIGGGITLNANTISSTGSTLTIDPAAAGTTGTVVIAGNLTVQGTTTTYESTTVTINDLVFTTANNAATATAANGGGIEVGPAGASYATWTYDQPNSRWTTALGINATGNVSAGNVSGTRVSGTNGDFTNVSGNGSALTALNGSNISSGTLAQARLANASVTIGNTTATLGATVTTITGLTSVTSTTFVGALTGAATTAGTVTTNAQPNITSVGTLSSLTVTGNISGANVIATTDIYTPEIVKTGSNAVGNIGQSTNYFNTVFAQATSALYADLAEKYVADAEYAPGTVVVFGGDKEVTVTSTDADRAVAGVVSTNPSYIMNAGLEADYVATVALTGRVPCLVTGTVRKGDLMVSAGYGRARAEADPKVGTVIGKALENHEGNEGVIEVVVGRF